MQLHPAHAYLEEEALTQLETRLLRRIDQLEDRVIAVLEMVLLGKS